MLSTPVKTGFDTDLRNIFLAARGLMRRYGKERLKESLDLDGTHFTLGARATKGESDTFTGDLPEKLGTKPGPALRRAYRTLRKLRAQLGPDAPIRTGDIGEQWGKDYPNKVPKKDTVKQAMRLLRKKEVAWHTPERGWLLDDPQAPLFAATAAQQVREERARAEQAKADCRAHATRPDARFVWVPGEFQPTAAGGPGAVIVRDALGHWAAEVPGWNDTYMRYTDWKDRLQVCPAVRCEVTRRDGRHLEVKLPTGEKIYTRVLGDWHLEGRSRPPELDEADLD